MHSLFKVILSSQPIQQAWQCAVGETLSEGRDPEETLGSH